MNEEVSDEVKKRREYHKQHRAKNPMMHRLQSQRENQRLKADTFTAYGGQCAICGELHPWKLHLDHIDGDGGKHRKDLNATGYAVYRDLRRRGFPPGFQVLCANDHHRKTFPITEVKTAATRSIRKLKAGFFDAYGGECALCGETDRWVLTLDHVFGGGRKARAGKAGPSCYRDARDRKYPADYRVLCHNCNHYEETRSLMNPLARFVRGRKINIDAGSWADVKRRMSREDISFYLATLDFDPLRDFDAETALRDFRGMCAWAPVWGDTIPFSSYGSASSNHFHERSRYKSVSHLGLTFEQIWGSPKHRRRVINGLWVWGADEGVTNVNFLRYLNMFVRMPGQFKPSAAKAIYEHYGAKRVLDCCAGWGDRLSGFCASVGTERYVGIDPNASLHDDYKRQMIMYGHGKSAEFICNSVEDVKLTERFDLSFTSPPYFNAERYSNDAGQSCVRYKTLPEWTEGFLRPLMALQASIVDGPVMVNIANHKKYQLESLVVSVASECGLKLVEVLKYPISNRAGGGSRFEPVLVFRR